jgi:hypothetical protein
MTIAMSARTRRTGRRTKRGPSLPPRAPAFSVDCFAVRTPLDRRPGTSAAPLAPRGAVTHRLTTVIGCGGDPATAGRVLINREEEVEHRRKVEEAQRTLWRKQEAHLVQVFFVGPTLLILSPQGPSSLSDVGDFLMEQRANPCHQCPQMVRRRPIHRRASVFGRVGEDGARASTFQEIHSTDHIVTTSTTRSTTGRTRAHAHGTRRGTDHR